MCCEAGVIDETLDTTDFRRDQWASACYYYEHFGGGCARYPVNTLYPYTASLDECCYAANSEQVDADHLLNACVNQVEN